MPYRIIWDNRHVTFEYSGEVTSRDIIESNEKVYGDPRFDDLRWQLVLLDEVASVSYTQANVKLITYMDQGAALSNPRITVAFVGSSDLLRELEESYARAGAKPAWPVVRFDRRDQALEHIQQSSSGARDRR